MADYNIAGTETVSPIKQSSISVAVRVRPFTDYENNRLIRNDNEDIFLGDGCLSGPPQSKLSMAQIQASSSSSSSQKKNFMPLGIRKILDVVDDKMLIFDPPETNPIAKMQKNAFPNSFKGSRIREHKFVFDKLFDEDATQQDVYYNTTRPLLDSVLDGYNATVFAYGATGCGKTHTISGTHENPGVIFLTMKELYERIEEKQDTKIIDVSLSYLEIYNETIRDLLAPETDFKKLIIREDSNRKISVSNLSCHRPDSVEQVMDLIMQGNLSRTSSPTEANATSSRSHAVLQINIVQKNRTGDIKQEHTFATLSIIDLAGSERAAATKNRGARLNEGANINKSLLALGNCINALCDPRRRNHVPFRDSKLTRLLKFSLGGNCKTVMIVCVSPSSQHYDETLNTLKYADRAKEIKTKVIRNQHNLDRHVGSYLKMITEQKQEIEELRARESKIAEADRERQRKLAQRAYNILQDSIVSVRQRLAKYSPERCRRCMLLAKRKLLIIQKVEVEQLMNFNFVNQQRQDLSPPLSTIYDLCEQVISKVHTQIPEIEEQYKQSYDVDYILGESATQTLSKLQGEEGWFEFHTTIYSQSIDSLQNQVQTDQLVKSSALFDQLIESLKDYLYIPKLLTNTGSSLDQTIQMLQSTVSGDFETALQFHANEYMKKWNWYSQMADDVALSLMPLQEQDQNVYNSQPARKSRASSITSPISRDMKKMPPLKRNKSTSSPSRKPKKIQKWGNGHVLDNTKPSRNQSSFDAIVDSSFEDVTFQNNSAIASIERAQHESPNTNQVLDLDLQFDPVLESPPSPPILQTQPTLLRKSSSSKKVSDNLKQIKIGISNGEESVGANGNGNLNGNGNGNIPNLNKKLNYNLVESKMPLLNTSAAAKVTQDAID
ncbi:KIP3 [Candida oxycetoniae]|uniref:Kinesin-like protein n=1 Tax=Candida oxycetoniae TaxID=497107 RepID=A0AAI9SZU3_9ASCO|nr:KIP3 [Candida oxycetoniae]KAI3406253.2 KIP3 [Candida oxycetoniae]